MKKPAIILISITAAFVLILMGFFIGRISKDGSIGVYTQRSVRTEKFTTDETRPPVIVNINTANAEELQDLPGIGPNTAEAIIAYREENGPFEYKMDLLNVKGIGEKTYQEIKSLITVKDED